MDLQITLVEELKKSTILAERVFQVNLEITDIRVFPSSLSITLVEEE